MRGKFEGQIFFANFDAIAIKKALPVKKRERILKKTETNLFVVDDLAIFLPNLRRFGEKLT